MSRETDGPDLRADDPRLSEWLDGRLPAVEAAAVARRVAELPDLARVAADLRRLKALLRSAPAADVPAGFAADVLAALDAPPRLAPGTAGGPADARVDAEWERIELERIAGEIAEAREDAAVAETTPDPRHGWPWMTMAAALAAGVLVAAFVNMQPLHSVLVENGRDVAVRDDQAAQERLKRSVDGYFDDEVADARRAGDAAAVTDADHPAESPATAQPPAQGGFTGEEADKLAAKSFGQAGEGGLNQDAAKAPPAAAAPPGGGELAGVSATKGAGGGGGRGAGPGAGNDLDPALRNSTKDLKEAQLAALDAKSDSGAAQAAKRTAPLIVAVRGPEGRAEFAALIAARGIRFESKFQSLRRASRDETATDGVDSDLMDHGELVEISGPPAAIQDLIATLHADARSRTGLAKLAAGRIEQEQKARLEARSLGRAAAAPEAKALDRKPGEALSASAESVAEAETVPRVRLLVRLIDISQAYGSEAEAGGQTGGGQAGRADPPAAEPSRVKDAETSP